MWQSVELRFASDHPTASGHFPANPIIPGALMLDEVVAAIAGEAGPGAIQPGAIKPGAIWIRTTKFLQPVQPGQSISLRWQSIAGGAIKFECRLAGQTGLAMTGTIEIGPAQP